MSEAANTVMNKLSGASVGAKEDLKDAHNKTQEGLSSAKENGLLSRSFDVTSDIASADLRGAVNHHAAKAEQATSQQQESETGSPVQGAANEQKQVLGSHTQKLSGQRQSQSGTVVPGR